MCINVHTGCSTAVNDLVYIVDGSWSVGFTDFDTAKQWLINITSQFDVSPYYTQVQQAIVTQYGKEDSAGMQNGKPAEANAFLFVV